MTSAAWRHQGPLTGSVPGLARRVGVGAALALGLLAYWLAWLGAAPLFDVDEGAFAEATREMLASRDWWHTTLNGADRFDKPILVYWLQAAGVALLGRDEFAVRLPSALCAWLWCLSTAAFVAPRWGHQAAVAAAAIIATSVGPLLIGRGATADALLNLLLALSLFDLLRFAESVIPSAESQAGQAALRRAALWMGLGVLAKGPVAALIPAGALIMWAIAVRGSARRVLVRSVSDPWSWIIGAAVAIPWYAYALHRHGWAFVDGFLMRHNVERFTGTLEGHSGSLYYYILVLPLVMLPWAPMLVPVLGSLWRRARQDGLDATCALLLAWTAFVMVFFSLSGTKLPHYLLYGYTPLAVLVGAWLGNRRESSQAVMLVFVCCAGLVMATLFSPDVAAWIGGRQKDSYWQALTQRSGLPAAPPMWWALPALIAVGAAAVLMVRRPATAWGASAAAALAAGLWFNVAIVPWWGETLQGPVRQLALDAAARGLPLVQWRLHQPSVGFYSDAPAPKRAPEAGEAALTRVDRIDAPGDDRPESVRVLRQERGLALVVVPGQMRP